MTWSAVNIFRSKMGMRPVCTFVAASNVNARSSIPTSVGPVQTVFDWSEARCARWDIPDTPARAWRGPDGKVRLVSGSERSRAGIGAELGDVARDCRIIYEGSKAEEPGDHDDRACVHATFAHDDGLIEALAHGDSIVIFPEGTRNTTDELLLPLEVGYSDVDP